MAAVKLSVKLVLDQKLEPFYRAPHKTNFS